MLDEGIRLKNAMHCGERSEYLINAAHKRRSHKNKKTSISSFLQITKKVWNTFKKRNVDL